LAIESSGFSGGVAALEGSELRAAMPLNPQQRSAQSLAPAMQELLARVGWQPCEVQVVAVAIGPGSFTGLRVGVTTAKTFAFAVSAEIVGVTTLEVIARQTPAELRRPGTRIVAGIDAYRQEVFSATFEVTSDGGLKNVNDIAIIDNDAWLAGLRENEIVTGPALEKLASRVPPGVIVADATLWQPQAASVGVIAAKRYAAGMRDDMWKLAPLYVRRSAAEEKLPTPRGRGG
jgi:tRNA threonylcarbamoyladenosine biosynthesis protein TsaB